MSRKKIAAPINTATASAPPASAPPPIDIYNLPHSHLTSVEARSALRCSERSLLRLYMGYHRSDGTFTRAALGFTRRGGRVLFAKSEIIRYLEARTAVVS